MRWQLPKTSHYVIEMTWKPLYEVGDTNLESYLPRYPWIAPEASDTHHVRIIAASKEVENSPRDIPLFES
jgi:hypothetical protein